MQHRDTVHQLALEQDRVHGLSPGELRDASMARLAELVDAHYSEEAVSSPDWSPWEQFHDPSLDPFAGLRGEGEASWALDDAARRARKALLEKSHAARAFPDLADAGAEMALAAVSRKVCAMREKALAADRDAASFIGAIQRYGARRTLGQLDQLTDRKTRIKVLQAAAEDVLASAHVQKDGHVSNGDEVVRNSSAIVEAIRKEGGAAGPAAAVEARAAMLDVKPRDPCQGGPGTMF